MADSVDVLVVGAGQAGLATSYFLARDGVRHVVLERGAIGESWRSQRWDSFHLNTPNWSNGLPGLGFTGGDPDAFAHRDELVEYLERYARTFSLPVRDHTPVTSLKRLPTGQYEVGTPSEALLSKAVVLASGSMSLGAVPEMAARLPPNVLSLSASEYRNPASLPPGAVVVVGSGQSGCQIAEDLLDAGRSVFLCASRVGRAPRTYRGRDILSWWSDMGLLNMKVEDLEDPSMQFATQPQVSGTSGGHTVSLQSLARDGATLLGRAVDVQEGSLLLGDDLLDSVAFADEKSGEFKRGIDEWIERRGLHVEPPSEDPASPPCPTFKAPSSVDFSISGEPGGVRGVVYRLPRRLELGRRRRVRPRRATTPRGGYLRVTGTLLHGSPVALQSR